MRWKLVLTAVMASCIFLAGATTVVSQTSVYVGSEICGDCHPDEYENYTNYSKKAKSWESIEIMASDLTAEEQRDCYTCHTTGYGEEGGFVSYEQTPELADAGCEVCHGPGSEHVDYGGDPAYILGDLDIDGCETCHNPERVRAFDFKPMLFGGAH
jgi:hypothetical protein